MSTVMLRRPTVSQIHARLAEHTPKLPAVFRQEDLYSRQFVGGMNLEGIIFRDCDLSAARFWAIRMIGAKFINCLFYRTSIRSVDLEGAVFENCTFYHAWITQSGLNRTTWNGSNLQHCDLRKCLVETSNFSGSIMNYVDMAGCIWANNTLGSSQNTNIKLGNNRVEVPLGSAELKLRYFEEKKPLSTLTNPEADDAIPEEDEMPLPGAKIVNTPDDSPITF